MGMKLMSEKIKTTIPAAAMVKWLRNSSSSQWTATKLEKAAAIIERLAARVKELEHAD